MAWYDWLARSRPRLILSQGEDRSQGALASLLGERTGVQAELPQMYETIFV